MFIYCDCDLDRHSEIANFYSHSFILLVVKSSWISFLHVCQMNDMCIVFILMYQVILQYIWIPFCFYFHLNFIPAFAFGSVTLDGLHIASYFESPSTKDCKSVIFILVYVMHLLFTFVQTFFLFKNHKVSCWFSSRFSLRVKFYLVRIFFLMCQNHR